MAWFGVGNVTVAAAQNKAPGIALRFPYPISADDHVFGGLQIKRAPGSRRAPSRARTRHAP